MFYFSCNFFGIHTKNDSFKLFNLFYTVFFLMKTKKSLNPIPLSLRDKKRYLVFELICDKRLNEREVSFELKKNFLKLFGELGLSKMNYQFIQFNEKSNKGILKCRHTALDDLKAGLLLFKEVKGIQVIPKTLKASGTAKKAKSFI